MSENLSRRRFLARSGSLALLGGLYVSSPFVRNTRAANPVAPKVEILETKILNPDRASYLGWPTLGQKADGELFAVCSGRRESHVCPFGQVWLYRSKDQGTTWSQPQTIYDSPIDDRDAGILFTKKGTVLITSFTSLAYVDALEKEAAARKAGGGTWAKERFERWWGEHDRITAEQRKKELGCWVFRSEDGGITWDARIDSLVNSPHGPIQLSDGRIMYPGKELWTEAQRNGVTISKDEGKTWTWSCEIPTRPGDDPKSYHELHGVEAPSGKIIVQIRNHNAKNVNETLQCESTDGGMTWSTPHEIGVWGLPSQLLRLRDGRLLMSYGHRRPPFGNQTRISSDEGQTWSEPMTISADGPGGDLGYPSSVELADGTILTLWYEVMKGNSKAVLRLARFKILD